MSKNQTACEVPTILPGEAETGYWCDECLTPTRIRIPLHAKYDLDTPVTEMGLAWPCLNYHPDEF